MTLEEKDEAKKPQEKKLFSKIKKRDKEAFIEAYDLYVDHLYRFIFFKVNNEAEAQDLTSAVFLKAWNHIQENSIKDYKTLRALLYKIARNTVIDHYRKNANVDHLSIDNEDAKIDLVDKGQDILEKAEVKSDYEIIISKLDELKEEYREVVVLRYVNELSISEIAKALDQSKGNIRVRLSRAMEALRKMLDESGGE